MKGLACVVVAIVLATISSLSMASATELMGGDLFSPDQRNPGAQFLDADFVLVSEALDGYVAAVTQARRAAEPVVVSSPNWELNLRQMQNGWTLAEFEDRLRIAWDASKAAKVMHFGAMEISEKSVVFRVWNPVQLFMRGHDVERVVTWELRQEVARERLPSLARAREVWSGRRGSLR